MFIVSALSNMETSNQASRDQARREPQRGPGKRSCGALKHFHGAPLGKIFLNFLFKMVHSGVLYKFLSDDGAPKRRGARVS